MFARLKWLGSLRVLTGALLMLAASQAPAQQVEDPVLNLHFQNNNVFIPHAVAREKGWFADAGFTDVEFKSFTAGALAGEALLAGEISAWMPGNVPIISMRHNALSVVVVGNIVSVYEKLVVRPDAGVKTPEDLYRIRIGLLEGSTASAMLDNIATHYELDASKLQIVNLPPPEEVTALTSNEVQAIVVWEPFASQGRDAVDGKFLYENNISHFEQDDGAHFAASHTRVPIVFSEQYLREKPETAKAIVKVLVKATEWVLDPANKEEAIKIFAKATERSEESIANDWSEYFFSPALDQSYLDDMRNYTAFMEKAGRISNAIDPLDYTYTGILQEIDPKYVQIDGHWKP